MWRGWHGPCVRSEVPTLYLFFSATWGGESGSDLATVRDAKPVGPSACFCMHRHQPLLLRMEHNWGPRARSVEHEGYCTASMNTFSALLCLRTSSRRPCLSLKRRHIKSKRESGRLLFSFCFCFLRPQIEPPFFPLVSNWAFHH